MKKKILSILLTLVMLLGVFAPVSILPASAAGPIEGATGSGTKNDPVIADDVIKLNKALEYDGPLYIVLTDFDITNMKNGVISGVCKGVLLRTHKEKARD